jgi:hypothetical protein
VALRKYQYKDLDRQFFRNYFLPRLAAFSAKKSSLTERCSLVDEVLNGMDRRFSRVNEDLVNTKANLSFDIFTDICLVCGVPTDAFSDKAEFLDVFLLKRRNAIAHGEDTLVGIEDLDQLTTETVAMMRAFGDALENRVVLKNYRNASALGAAPAV